jgi:Histidine kinase
MMGDEAAAALRLLDITRALRAAERGYLAGWLHDRPIQDLAAATLELGLAKRAIGPAAGDQLDVPERQVETAGRSLRRLVDELSPFPRAGTGLAAALERRTAWLLAAPLAVNLGPGAADLSADEIEALADLVELILLGVVSQAAPGTLAAVQADRDVIVVELNVRLASGDPAGDPAGSPVGDPAAVTEWLDGLAAAMRTRADTELRGSRLRVRVRIPRRRAQ